MTHFKTSGDISQIKIFNQLTNYRNNRDKHSLSTNRLINALDQPTKEKVIASLLKPDQNILRLHQFVLNNKPYLKLFVDHLIELSERIVSALSAENIALVAVLRSGLPLAFLIQDIIYKKTGVITPISGLTPNYIEKIDNSAFKNFVVKNKKTVVFVDGWISEGVTYNIIKKFWNSLFPKQSFYFGVISNPSVKTRDPNIFSASPADILVPWSMATTDNTRLSNYFIHPSNHKSSAFLLPKSLLSLPSPLQAYYDIVDARINTKNNKSKQPNLPKNNKADPTHRSNHWGKLNVKLGINETIKSLEKGIGVKILIDKKNIHPLCKKVLFQYAVLYKVGVEFVPQSLVSPCHCAIIRKK